MDFNSFIETNEYGGYIVLENTNFNYFSSCGAIVRNFKKTFTSSFKNSLNSKLTKSS